jgi:hypothetical protein
MKNVKAVKTETQYILPTDRDSYDRMVEQVSQFIRFDEQGQDGVKYMARAILKTLGIDPKRRARQKPKPEKALLCSKDSIATAKEFGSQLESACNGIDPFDFPDDDDGDEEYSFGPAGD